MYMPENYMDIKWQMIILVADVKDIKPKDSNKNSTSRKSVHITTKSSQLYIGTGT